MNEERTGKCLRQVEYIRGHRTCTLIIYFLKGKTTISRNLILKDANGHTMNAMKVFSESIKYLKDYFVEKSKSVENLEETDIHWVLTVPAIWKDNAKQFMREAAQQVFFYLSY